MTQQELEGVMKLCESTAEGDWAQLPEGRSLTAHVASQGVSLSVSKICKLRSNGGQIQAITTRGETYVFSLADVFACAIDDSGTRSRKAGFVS